MVADSPTLPPGTILQLMYLRERLARMPAGMFVEIGPGSGEITRLLLELGWQGTAYDLETQTTERLQQRFAEAIAQGRLRVANADFLQSATPQPVDLVISCMVMEHLTDAEQQAYMEAARRALKPGGQLIGLVPGSPKDWGIEDDIAGHQRRYTRPALLDLAQAHRWRVAHMAGLTYPVSNLLLPISNALVKRAESSKLELSAMERTKQSGRRTVAFKTHFPGLLKLLLNDMALLPLHWLQKAFAGAERALVLYFEAEPV